MTEQRSVLAEYIYYYSVQWEYIKIKNNNNNEMSGEGIGPCACSVGVTMMWARTDYLSLVVEQRTRIQYYCYIIVL